MSDRINITVTARDGRAWTVFAAFEGDVEGEDSGCARFVWRLDLDRAVCADGRSLDLDPDSETDGPEVLAAALGLAGFAEVEETLRPLFEGRIELELREPEQCYLCDRRGCARC